MALTNVRNVGASRRLTRPERSCNSGADSSVHHIQVAKHHWTRRRHGVYIHAESYVNLLWPSCHLESAMGRAQTDTNPCVKQYLRSDY